ncbi:MAG: aspartate kinase [Candidatus Kariarchaeaceae archaeon]
MVHKFGGTCTGSLESIQKIVTIIKEEQNPCVIALSAAFGVTTSIENLLHTELTDELIDDFTTKLLKQHIALLPPNSNKKYEIEGIITRLKRLLIGIIYTDTLPHITSDLILTFGERLISVIIQDHLEIAGKSVQIVYPEEIIITDGYLSAAFILPEETKSAITSKLLPFLEVGKSIIVPGYYGISQNNKITLLGRSGTDYTATTLGVSLKAEQIIIWKDVSGFNSADPTIVRNTHTIPQLSYDEAAELAHFGATLLHPRAVNPAKSAGIPIYIKDLNDLGISTVIDNQSEVHVPIIKCISHLPNLAIFKIFTSISGNSRNVLTTISDKIQTVGIDIISLTTSQSCISYLVKNQNLVACKNAVEGLGGAVVNNVEIHGDLGLICLVGAGLAETPNIAQRILRVVAEENVNIDLISAGGNPTALYFAVKTDYLTQCLQAIHNEFF